MASKTAERREVTCREGHTFTTAAKPGTTLRCPERLPGGERCGVATYVPKRADGLAGPAAAWAEVAPWDGKLRLRADDDDPPECPDCGGAARRTPRGTMLWCLDERRAVPPEAASGRAALAAERAERASAVVRADPAAELRARLALAESRAASASIYRQWAALLDLSRPPGVADYLDDATAAECQRLAARLAALATEADRAADPEALAVVRLVAAEHLTAAKAVEDDVLDARAALADDDAADDDAADDDDEIVDAEIVDDDENGPPSGRRLALPPAGPRAICAVDGTPYPCPAHGHLPPICSECATVYPCPGGHGPRFPAAMARAHLTPPFTSVPVAPRPPRPGGAALLDLASAAQAARIERYGPCHFGARGHPVSVNVLGRKPPAPTRRVTGNATGTPGYATHGAPNIFICGAHKCLDLAGAHFRALGYPDCTYYPLEV